MNLVKDYLVRSIATHTSVRGLACVTSNLVDGACSLHGASGTACVALGRALTGALLMGALLKTGQRVALKFEGNGPLRKIVVEAESSGEVRGYVAVPDVDLPLKEGRFDVGGALGRQGLLTVVKDLRLKEPYTGVVQFSTGEIGDDLAFYLSESEQIPSAVGLGVHVGHEGRVFAAGGFLIQSFPPYDEKAVDEIIQGIKQAPPLTELLLRGKRPEEMLQVYFGDIPFDILERKDLAFRCSCSKERVEQALITLGREEIANLIVEQGNIDVTCEFCKERYHLSRNELEWLSKVM